MVGISVIIPSYNCGCFLLQTLTSCLSQDCKKGLEVIVIDDGSTDDTSEIMEVFREDCRVRYFHQENAGVSAARNLGISLAKGEYLTFLDADDTLDLDTLQKNIELMQENPDVDWLFFPIQRIDQNGKKVKEISPNLLPSFKYSEAEQITAFEAYTRMSRRMLPTCVCGSIYRSGFFDKTFQPGRFEDSIMAMELLRKKPLIFISPYGAYEYYDRIGSFINAPWDAEKWTAYVRAQIAEMETKCILHSDSKKDLEIWKTSFYYTLKYLKERERNKPEFDEPLRVYLERVGNVRFSMKKAAKCAIKTKLYRFRRLIHL